MDRNDPDGILVFCGPQVALRKESVDRNSTALASMRVSIMSLSARRAWIEMVISAMTSQISVVALRKESVDRNFLSPYP